MGTCCVKLLDQCGDGPRQEMASPWHQPQSPGGFKNKLPIDVINPACGEYQDYNAD